MHLLHLADVCQLSQEDTSHGGAEDIDLFVDCSYRPIVALLIYGKSATESIPAHALYKIAKEMTRAYQRLIFNPLRPACRSSASSIKRLTSSL